VTTAVCISRSIGTGSPPNETGSPPIRSGKRSRRRQNGPSRGTRIACLSGHFGYITRSRTSGCGQDTAAFVQAMTHKKKSQGFVAAMISFQCLGCGGTASLGQADDVGGDSADASAAPVGPTGLDDTVAVVLVNSSDFALDVRFHLSTDAEVASQEALFVTENGYRDRIGFLSLGILAPRESVARLFECTGALIFGTAGGEFLDDETGESVSQGSIRRFAALGPQFGCGSLVTFEFIVDDEGRPLAQLTIE